MLFADRTFDDLLRPAPDDSSTPRRLNADCGSAPQLSVRYVTASNSLKQHSFCLPGFWLAKPHAAKWSSQSAPEATASGTGCTRTLLSQGTTDEGGILNAGAARVFLLLDLLDHRVQARGVEAVAIVRTKADLNI